ncbi:hypothetical protein [Pedobacter arcticus]|uniref:hypothetical protein n=1 Tax=Pedobacter arcticus TaxID=752140 RepID=UPI00030DF832|nr:hypothetical protein [Pedobacter arcticus]
MKTIEYIKLQAKNLHKDFKTQKPYFDSTYGRDLFEYAPKFFDIEALISDFEIDENNFTLMNAQHIIAKLGGFQKWTDMLKASQPAMELAKLLFDNMHKITNEEWDYYILDVESENNITLDDEDKLDIFKTVFADVDGHQSDGYDYRLGIKKENLSEENQTVKPKRKKVKNKTTVMISALPLASADRLEFTRTANSSFERVFDRIEPENPELVREMWDAEKYIYEDVLRPDTLPIHRDYALSIVDAFMVGYVIQLAVEADDQAANCN